MQRSKSSLIGKWKFLTVGYKNDFSHIDILTLYRSFQKFWPTKQTIHFKSPASPFTPCWEFFMSRKDHRTSKKEKIITLYLLQVFTFGWREDIRVGDPMHTKKVCFDAISHNSPVTLYDCHGMKGNQLWRYRKVWQRWSGDQSEPSAWLCVMFVWWALSLSLFVFLLQYKTAKLQM